MNLPLLLRLFWVMTRVSLLSWGGGPASLALMQAESVREGFITREEFVDAVALGNALPGPIAPQVAAYIGQRQAGVPGAVSAAAGSVLPTTLLMLIMLFVFFGIKDSPVIKSMLQAVRPAVVGLLLWTAYDLGSSVLRAGGLTWQSALIAHWDKFLIVLVTFLLLTIAKINPAFLVLGAAIVGFVIYR